MSKMMMRSDRKPPLAAARSPIRLRPRRALQSTASTILSTPVTSAKTQLPNCKVDAQQSELRPEYRTISSELFALANKLRGEFGNGDPVSFGLGNASAPNRSPLFERGRFYDEYSARRNERLKRRKGETGDEKKTVYGLGVRVESAKKRESKKFESVRKTLPATPVTERRENSRYSLRSSCSKENKKPPLGMNFEKSVAAGNRKVGPRRVRKNWD
ncbi:hypothetical protein RJ639_028568 [Escallonia herrerae]|uniref:Uncharacterized protein n=1 Tax=Escallonia herrerae TaxID=1293975 RepID=A0AA88X3C1_9ASTE|nr:hypothetical protein RJ639_028568 [Escallonia herrerae]